MVEHVGAVVCLSPTPNGHIHDNTVTGGWAGSGLSWAGALMSWAGAEMIWAGALKSMKYSYLNCSTFKLLNNAKKIKV